MDLEQAIYEAFATSDGWHPVDHPCDGWLDLARQCGLAVADRDGTLLPDVLDAISHIVPAAIWFGPHHRLPEANRQVRHSRKAPAVLAPELRRCDLRRGTRREHRR